MSKPGGREGAVLPVGVLWSPLVGEPGSSEVTEQKEFKGAKLIG